VKAFFSSMFLVHEIIVVEGKTRPKIFPLVYHHPDKQRKLSPEFNNLIQTNVTLRIVEIASFENGKLD